MKGIQQTKEALAFIAGLIASVIKAYSDDQKVGKMEIVGIITGNVGGAVDAFKGIAEVPAELADIQPEEADELYWAVIQALHLPDNSTSRDLFTANYNFLRVCIQHWRVMQNTLSPPKAEVIPEPVAGTSGPRS
jgi:hypothetical protein